MLKLIYVLVLVLKWISPIYSEIQECQIFLLTTCPPAATEEVFARNPKQYCSGVKANVDCVNEMLKNCSYNENLFQAMKTLKLIYQVSVQQANNHGCKNITDKIILPGDEILKIKPTTPKPVEVTTGPKEKSVVNSVDPECLRNLTNIECEKLEPRILRYILDDSNIDDESCERIIQYTDCVQKKFSGECLVKFDKTVTHLQRINQACNFKMVSSDEAVHESNRASDVKVKKFLVIVYVILTLYSKVF